MSCNCTNTGDLSGPGSCCPDILNDGASNILVTDRNCDPKRLAVVPKSLVGNSAQGAVRSLDGSDLKPLLLNLAKRISGDGGAIIQTGEGRLLSILPAPEGESLPALAYFGVSGGELKFIIPDAGDITWDDSLLPSQSTGIIPVLTCAAGGRVGIGKFLPAEGEIPEGSVRIMVIDSQGNISWLDKEFDDCPEGEDSDSVDAILACNAGKYAFFDIEPGEFITKNESGKFVGQEFTSGLHWISPVTVHSSTGNFNARSDSFDLSSIPELAANGATGLKMKVVTRVGSSGSLSSTVISYTVTINGEIIAFDRVRGNSSTQSATGGCNDFDIQMPVGGSLEIVGTPSPVTNTQQIDINIILKGYYT